MNHSICESCGITTEVWRRDRKTVCADCAQQVDKGLLTFESALAGSAATREEVITAEAGEHYPPHYQLNNGRQSLEFIEATLTPEQFEGFLRGNALKYLIRYDRKGQSASDLNKATDYTQRLRSYVAARSATHANANAPTSRGKP
jgi:hypothetical protein